LQVIEEKSVTFYLKYISPNGRLSRNSTSSPTGYTTSTLRNLKLGGESISIGGWGHSEEGTFEVGNHKIEIYFDDYLIHTVDFEVVLAPIEKLEIELKNAEKKLSEINASTYFESEIKKAENDMNRVKEWQFLRTKSDREMQIKNQQKIIDDVIRKSVEEKNSQVKKQQLIIADIKAKMEKLN